MVTEEKTKYKAVSTLEDENKFLFGNRLYSLKGIYKILDERGIPYDIVEE